MYYIFISHSWEYDEHYQKLKDLLNKGLGEEWQDYSIPKDDPVHAKGEKELIAAIDKKIKCCSCLIVLAGVYATYRKWIKAEVDIAKRYNKKIIAVEIYDSKKTSLFVKNNATSIVTWRSKSLVNAIID